MIATARTCEVAPAQKKPRTRGMPGLLLSERAREGNLATLEKVTLPSIMNWRQEATLVKVIC